MVRVVVNQVHAGHSLVKLGCKVTLDPLPSLGLKPTAHIACVKKEVNEIGGVVERQCA